MRIETVDVADDGQVSRFWQAGRDADAFERPYATYWSLRTASVALRDRDNPFEQHPVVAVEGDEVVGTSLLSMPRLDNTHVAFLGLGVRPGHRGRGVGSMLLEAAIDEVSGRARTTVITEANLPLDDARPDGSLFLERRGFTRASVELHRVLDLPVDRSLLDALESGTTPYRGDYQVVCFGDRVPDEFMRGFCILQSAFNSEVPLGELDLEPEGWDEDRVRNTEARFELQGRHRRACVAIARDGSLVALTEMITAGDQAWQSGTLVLPGHRGHRLGMVIKLANLLAFQAEFPTTEVIHSWNAEENGPMVAINEALGFRPVEYLIEMQRTL